jgi:hypothetical protein
LGSPSGATVIARGPARSFASRRKLEAFVLGLPAQQGFDMSTVMVP